MPKGQTDPEVLRLMDTFEFAYRISSQDLERMQTLQKVYDNVIDTSSMPTMSEIPIPMLFTMVEKSLPSAMGYLFPKDAFIRLNPIERGIPMDRLHDVEWALQNTVTKKVKLEYTGLPTIKDCLKFGVGFGVVEPKTVTPPALSIIDLIEGGKTIGSKRVIAPGEKRRTVMYKSVGVGQILTTKDGTDFNGDNRVTAAFYVDLYTEAKFRRLYEDGGMLGSVDEIIKKAQTSGFNINVPIQSIVANLAGLKLSKYSGGTKGVPIIIPVIKCYEDGKHTWIANGDTKIYEIEESTEILRCPLVKASAWPEGQRFYPMSPVEASYKMAIGMNIWVNAIFDLMTHHIKPLMIYDKTKFVNGEPERTASGILAATGDADKAVSFAAPPPVNPNIFTVGDMVQRMFGDTVGQNTFLDQPQPGLLRSGAFSFESLLQTTTGRERLIGAVLETGWLESTIEHILLNMQSNIGKEGFSVDRRQYDNQSGEESLETVTITPDDLVNAFELELSLKEKYRATAANFAQKQADLNVGINSPYTDKYEVMMDYYGDEARAKRLLKPREQIQQMDQQEQEMSMQERAMGIEKQKQQQQSTMGDQALAGAGAAALGGL